MAAAVSAESVLNQFLSVLGHLGWGLGRLARPQALSARRRDPAEQGCWVALALPEGHTLLVLAIEESLPDLSASFKNYQDLAPAHRRTFRLLAAEGMHARFLLLLGKAGAHMIDIEEEDVLLALASREEMDDRLYPLLDMQALVRGSLSAFPRKSVRQRARELAEWTNVWSARIGSALELTQPAAARFFEWLHLARVAELNRLGSFSGAAFEEFALPGAPSPKRLLDERFHALHSQWFLLQDNCLKAHLDIVSRAARSDLLAGCLASYALLSRSKFSAHVLAEAFADEELRLRSWRSSLVYDLPGEEAGEDIAGAERWLTESYDVDLDEAGYVIMLRAFDRLVELVRGVALERESARERGERPGLQLDFLSAAPADITPYEAVRHVLRHALRVRTAQAQRLALARLALLASACEWTSKLHTSDAPFPRPQVELAAQSPEAAMAANPGTMN